MEILNNFASIYCLISFIIGAVLMLVALAIAAMGKDDVPRNKVRFFVTREYDICEVSLILWMGAPKYDNIRGVWVPSSMYNHYLSNGDRFLEDFNLNPNDFADMKEGEIREVFLNLED